MKSSSSIYLSNTRDYSDRQEAGDGIQIFVLFWIMWGHPKSSLQGASCLQLWKDVAYTVKTRFEMSRYICKNSKDVQFCLILSAYPCISVTVRMYSGRLKLHFFRYLTKNIDIHLILDTIVNYFLISGMFLLTPGSSQLLDSVYQTHILIHLYHSRYSYYYYTIVSIPDSRFSTILQL